MQNAIGEIKNGYEKDLQNAINELRFMESLIMGGKEEVDEDTKKINISPEQEIIINKKIKSLKEIIVYYMLTEQILKSFKSISPDLYAEINEIVDHDNIPVHVYVKIVSADNPLNANKGITILSKHPTNEHSCISPYGAQTVSINVCAMSIALKILAHEFGHVKFVVPNFSEYLEYCKKRYGQDDSKSLVFGHQASDMGSKTVFEYEKRFKEAYKLYLKDENNTEIIPRKILKDIKSHINWNDLFSASELQVKQ
jgi:hypothetical protein